MPARGKNRRVARFDICYVLLPLSSRNHAQPLSLTASPSQHHSEALQRQTYKFDSKEDSPHGNNIHNTGTIAKYLLKRASNSYSHLMSDLSVRHEKRS